jgi:hypothetical protein
MNSGQLVKPHLDRANLKLVTPLHLASRGTSKDVVNKLLKANCDKEKRSLAGFKPKDLVQTQEVKEVYVA